MKVKTFFLISILMSILFFLVTSPLYATPTLEFNIDGHQVGGVITFSKYTVSVNPGKDHDFNNGHGN